MPLQDHTELQDNVAFAEGLPEWIHPSKVTDTPDEYYLKLEDKETIEQGLKRFKSLAGVELISSSSGGSYGRTIQPGQLGLYFNRGRARFRTPGKYWRSGYRCEWAKTYAVDKSVPLISHGDVTIIQLGQNQTAAVLRPDQTVSVLSPGRHIVRDRMKVIGNGVYNRSGINKESGRVDTFVQHIYDGAQWRASLIDVPKDMAAVIEMVRDGAELAIVPPGRYTITEEGVKFKKLLTLFEEERTLSKISAFCSDSVQVFLDLQLRFKLQNPKLIAHTKYADAFDVLQESAQSAVQSIVGQINYQQMIQSISLDPGRLEEKDLPDRRIIDHDFVPFDEQVRIGCLEYLDKIGRRVGIEVIECFVKTRYFNQEITQKMQKQAISTLTSVTKAKNVKRDLETERKRVNAEAENGRTVADAEFYAAERISAARALEVRTTALAKAEETEVLAAAQAKAHQHKAASDARVKTTMAAAKAKAETLRREAQAFIPDSGDSNHAQKLALMKAYAQVAGAFGDKTVVLDTSSEMGKMFNVMSAGALASSMRAA